MVNNDSFTLDLKIKFLNILVSRNRKEEFNMLYDQYMPSLSSRVDETTDRELLSDLKSIIDYKKSFMNEKGMGR